MKKKGVYCYDYMESFEKFNDPQLPPKDKFYSILTGEGISDEQHQHAQNVWNTFNIKTMERYHDLYILNQISYYWRMYLRTLGRPAFRIIN